MFEVDELEALLYLETKCRLTLKHLRSELLQLLFEVEHVFGVVDDIHDVDRRCEQTSQHRFYVQQMMIVGYYGCSYHGFYTITD